MKRAAAAIACVVAAGAASWAAFGDPGAPAPDWRLVAPARVELAPGVAGTFEVDVVPAGGRTVSRDGPLRLDVKPGDGLGVARRRLALGDAVDPGAAAPRFAIKATGDKAGSYAIEVAVRFWLCARQSCKPVRGAATVTVDVVAPPAPDAAPAVVDAPPPPKKPRAKTAVPKP